MPWYKSGTVSVAQNSNAVIGTGTAFLANSRVGDAFRGPDGAWYEVINIASDTAMAIAPNYQGATNAAGIYALAPMQGYVKDSADALRAVVNAYGSKLAALGTTGNYDILPVSKGGTGGTDAAGARTGLGLGTVATENVVPVTKGGTGGATQSAARAGLGLGSAAVAAIVGTVSQSGGVPTGAIIETVTNANGTAIKFANGTMICLWQTTGFTLNANGYGNFGPYTLPAAFTSAASVVAVGSALPNSTYDFYGISAINVTSTNTFVVVIRNGAVAQSASASLLFIGRWF